MVLCVDGDSAHRWKPSSYSRPGQKTCSLEFRASARQRYTTDVDSAVKVLAEGFARGNLRTEVYRAANADRLKHRSAGTSLSHVELLQAILRISALDDNRSARKPGR
jgi:hypothetical protein